MKQNIIIKDIVLDLDGVFADFDSAVTDLFGDNWQQMNKNQFWRILSKHENFFKTIKLLPYAKELFNIFKDTNHFILTALPIPNGNLVNAREHKTEWVRENLCSKVPVETVIGGKNKGPEFARPDRLLIDDTLRNIEI